ncbi:MAG: diguanylate cyclase [Clostridiales bacterium]|nr:diguanylate cyclase [Clostridiales bacterium]
MLKIGDFARKNNVTVRALHHYEEIGLLEPVKTDNFSGYRYYEESQTKELRIVNILKELGFSLSEIKQLLKVSIEKDQLIRRLNEKYTQARIDLNRTQLRSFGIEQLMQVVEAMPSGKKVNLKEMSDMNISNMIENNPEKVFMRNYDEILKKAKEENRNITTMVMDIDRFKSVNDNYGHRVGDAVLDAIFREVINNFTKNPYPDKKGIFWGNTSILERKGGDECTIRAEIEPEDGIILANKICRAISEIDFSYVGIKEPVTVSIGVANLDSNPVNDDEFSHLAESAMYLAKHNGSNRVEIYTGDIKEKLNSNPV